MLTFFVPFATMFIFFFSLTMSSGFMLQSVSKEKENRVVEVLLLSLRSRELMLGKLLGLGSIALFQMLICSQTSSKIRLPISMIIELFSATSMRPSTLVLLRQLSLQRKSASTPVNFPLLSES